MHKVALSLSLLLLLLACHGVAPTSEEMGDGSSAQAASTALPLLTAPGVKGSKASPPSPVFPACSSLDDAIDQGPLPTASAIAGEPTRFPITTSRQAHRLAFDARAGDYLHLVVEQHHIDLVLSLLDAQGNALLRVDSLYGDRGNEEILWISPADGPFHLVVCGPQEIPKNGAFSAYIKSQHPAGDDDRSIAEAFLIYHTAEAKRRLGTEASRQEAIALYEEAAVRWKALDRTHDAALCTYGISRVYTDQRNKMDVAMQWVTQAMEELQAEGDWFLVGSSRHRLGYISDYTGNRREAIKQYQEALTIRRKIGHQFGELRTSINLAGTHLILGEFSQARDLNERALNLANKLGLRSQIGNIAYSLGRFYRNLNDYERALERLDQALKIRLELGDTEGIASTQLLIAQIYSTQGQHKRSLEQANLALALFKAQSLPRQQASALYSIGSAEMELGNPDVALEHYHRSLEISTGLDDLYQQAHTHQSIGWVLGETGKCEDAIANFEKAAKIYDKFGDTTESALAHENIAICLQWLGELERSIELARKALDLAESSRKQAISMSWRAKFFQRMRFYYDFLTDILVESSLNEDHRWRLTEALEVSEGSKARALQDAISSKKQHRKPMHSAGLSEVEILSERINQDQADRLLGANIFSGSSKDKYQDSSLLLEKYEMLSRRLGLNGTGLGEDQTLEIEGVREELGGDTTLLEFHIGYRESHLFLVDQERLLHFPLPKSDDIEMLAEATYRNLSSKARPVQTALLLEKISETLFTGVLEEVETQRILIVSDGPLHYLPLDSLPLPKNFREETNAEPNQRIGDYFDLIDSPSVTVLSRTREMRSRDPQSTPSHKIAIIADPIFHSEDARLITTHRSEENQEQGRPDGLEESSNGQIGGLERLIYSRDEAAAIASIAIENGWETQLFLGPDANKGIFDTGSLAQFEILHLATHADFNAKQPEFAHLLLSRFDDQGNHQEGFLFAYELYGMDLSVETVVLSTCNSALGSDIRGEGLVGLTQAFLQAGASRVVVTLWQVDDRATAALMSAFYQNLLGKGLEPSRALWLAKNSIRSVPEWTEPYYWAGFSLVGDWKPKDQL